jgi:RNA polymerase sigma-70 factor (ECF subfamily)
MIAAAVGYDPNLPGPRGGEVAELATQFAALHRRVLRYLRATVGEAAEDVASQVWLDVVASGGPSGQGEDDMRRWVFTIARRRSIDHRRRWWQRRVVVRAPDHPGWEQPSADAGPDSDDTEAALALISVLPAAQAEVVLLRVIGGLSAEEVAEITGQSPGSVRVMQHRALRRLRRQIEADGGWEV